MRCCHILPPHMTNALGAESTKLATHAMRRDRAILGGMRKRAPGELRRNVYDAGNAGTLPGKLVLTEGGKLVTDTAALEAFNGAGATYDALKSLFNRNSIDGAGMRLDSTVHYREDPAEPFLNAFFDGQQMVYGDGDGDIFGSFTHALDVIAHELTHGVTQFEADLKYENQPGALNESMSDVFGSIVLQYTNKHTVKNASWLIGEGLFTKRYKGSALRSLKAPGTAYNIGELGGQDPQPAHMNEYQRLPNTYRGDWGGVHINSGVPNRAFYLACVNLGSTYSWEAAGRIWYDALTNRLGVSSTFGQAKSATIAAAKTLFGTSAVAADAVKDAWETVGV